MGKPSMNGKKRLVRNFGLLETQPKYITLENSTCRFVCCGIEISQKQGKLSWRADPAVVDQWLCNTHMTPDNTPRNLFKVIGFLRHVAAIIGMQANSWEEYRKFNVTHTRSGREIDKPNIYDTRYKNTSL